MNVSRRRFLTIGGGAVLTGASCAVSMPAFAKLPDMSAAGCRSISFANLHTGEKLAVDYWADGAYVPGALADVNKILRDWRSGEVHAIEPNLLDLLSHLRQSMDSTEAFSVISGYRSPATNAALRADSTQVAKKSLHMVGMAIDIRLPGRDLSKLHQAAQALKLGGVGYYPKSDFVHVDVGRVRHWAGS
jgi:uncharacterized protein YcbK (DUF882 family)